MRLGGGGGSDKTLPSSGTLESRVEKSHPGQKDKFFSDVTGVVGRGQALNGHPPSTWIKLPLSWSAGTVMVTVSEIPTICHASGIQGPKTD